MPKANHRQHPGITLREVRTEQGLSLRALAERTGLPYSTLSKLENGKMSMTYDKLATLAKGLNVDLSRLVLTDPGKHAAPAAVGRRCVTRAGKWLNANSEQVSHHYPAAELLGKLMVPVIIEVNARSLEEADGMVRHAGEEYLYVLSGAMDLYSDLYAPLHLDQGDSVYFDSGMAHVYVRVSDEPCHVLSVCAGPGIQAFAEAAGKSWELNAPAGSRSNPPGDLSHTET